MKPVDQTILAVTDDGLDANGVPGNCYQACLASVMEDSLENIPHIAEMSYTWWLNAHAWAHSRGLIDTFLGIDDKKLYDELREIGDVVGVIGSGPSPRGNFYHAVVLDSDTLEIVHDPHPSRSGVTQVEGLEVIWKPKEKK